MARPNRKQAKGLKRRLLHKLRRFPQDDYEAREGREDAIQCASTDAAHACESKLANDGHETRCSNATLTSEPPWTVFRSAQVENGTAIPVVHLKARSARVPSGL